MKCLSCGVEGQIQFVEHVRRILDVQDVWINEVSTLFQIKIFSNSEVNESIDPEPYLQCASCRTEFPITNSWEVV